MDMSEDNVNIEDYAKAKKKGKFEELTISAPNFQTARLRVTGTAPYMQARFAKKAPLHDKMVAGAVAKKGSKREPRDFQRDFLEAQHLASEGWNGIPASAFRNAAIAACRVVGFKMTFAKMSVFIEADGFDKEDAMPLVKLDAPEPEYSELAVRNATGVVDLRARPLWRTWGCDLRVRFDADQFSLRDIVNLMARAGLQVGIGEGRPFSTKSAGLGLGTFTVELVEG